jgi:hypothetical protein
VLVGEEESGVVRDFLAYKVDELDYETLDL